MATVERTPRKFKIGMVLSNKAEKTITVKIERRVPHKLYQKYFKRSKKFLVHDPENNAGEGDLVKIMECRPISKNKSWRLVEVLERAE
ncbi:30S ribosomal protein S17 [bacterium]|nr:30S ribosomal protein S17 [bacterium]MBU1653141.1 30S ribosomal protein S17 [bacterium]